MRKILVLACVVGAFIASDALAARWVAISPKDKHPTFLYQPGSPYVETTTGLVHVSMCMMTPECAKAATAAAAAGDDSADKVEATDAVVDCKRQTIEWCDFLGMDHSYRLTGGANGRAASVKISPKSDFGILIGRLCAKSASLPRR